MTYILCIYDVMYEMSGICFKIVGAGVGVDVGHSTDERGLVTLQTRWSSICSFPGGNGTVTAFQAQHHKRGIIFSEALVLSWKEGRRKKGAGGDQWRLVHKGRIPWSSLLAWKSYGTSTGSGSRDVTRFIKSLIRSALLIHTPHQ